MFFFVYARVEIEWYTHGDVRIAHDSYLSICCFQGDKVAKFNNIRGRIFDRAMCMVVSEICLDAEEAVITDVST